METESPQIGITTIVRRNGKILLAKRKSKHGEGTWGFSGGKLELHESLQECARRELLEEAGLSAENFYLAAVTNDVFDDGKHYVTIFFIADSFSGEPVIKEPDKCECWEWFEWSNLPQPLFLPILNLLKQDFDPFKVSLG